MIAGASWIWWVGFHAAVVVLLAADWLLESLLGSLGRGVAGDRSLSSGSMSSERGEGRHPQLLAWMVTAALVLAAAGFSVWIGSTRGRHPALEFVTAYTIETSLSADNLIIFMVLFEGFRIGRQRQHTALLWGTGGAVVLRGLFIAAGVTLLKRFDWITWIFGLFLLYAAWRMLRGGSAGAAIPEWIRRLQPAKGSLLPVILAVEFTDLIFATDSIPAVLSVTHDPFVAYTSNIAAVLGLRSLYFALAGVLDRLRYLHYGLGALLGFVALKMLAARWIEIPISASLAVTGATLAACAIASWTAKGREPGIGNRE